MWQQNCFCSSSSGCIDVANRYGGILAISNAASYDNVRYADITLRAVVLCMLFTSLQKTFDNGCSFMCSISHMYPEIEPAVQHHTQERSRMPSQVCHQHSTRCSSS